MTDTNIQWEIIDGGALKPGDQWVEFNPGWRQVQLDGWFFPDQLRAIADHVERFGEKSATTDKEQG